jgi:hypothetical protein
MHSMQLRSKRAAPIMARLASAGPHYYAAFVLDPDGNNMEAALRGD